MADHLGVENDFLTADRMRELASELELQWEIKTLHWIHMDQVVLYQEVLELMTRAAFDWVGLPFRERKLRNRTDNFSILCDSAAGENPRFFRTQLARWSEELQLQAVVREIRKHGESETDQNSLTPAESMSFRRDPNGQLLSNKQAAHEILNLVQALIAPSVFIVYALHTIRRGRGAKLTTTFGKNSFDNLIAEIQRSCPFRPVTDMGEVRASEAGQSLADLSMKVGLNHLIEKMHFEIVPQTLSLQMADRQGMPRRFLVLKNVERKSASTLPTTRLGRVQAEPILNNLEGLH